MVIVPARMIMIRADAKDGTENYPAVVTRVTVNHGGDTLNNEEIVADVTAFPPASPPKAYTGVRVYDRFDEKRPGIHGWAPSRTDERLPSQYPTGP